VNPPTLYPTAHCLLKNEGQMTPFNSIIDQIVSELDYLVIPTTQGMQEITQYLWQFMDHH
jgi:hypothetical protein